MPPMNPEREAPTGDGSSALQGRRPIFAYKFFSARASTAVNPGQGSINPNNINMKGLMALFAIIGAGFVLAIIWFFFWAKNGGFVWRKGDWEEYKSTVLRRKGVNGKTLSNATESTDLGGGSIVRKGYSDDGVTVTDATETDIIITPPTVPTVITQPEEKREEPRRKRRRFRETAKQRLLRSRQDEKWEGAADEDMQAYRHEKPARIGGFNRGADGVYRGTDYTSTESPSTFDPESIPRENHHTRSVSGFSFTAGSDDIFSQATEEHLLRDPAASAMHRHGEHRRQRDGGGDHSSTTYTEPLDLSTRPPPESSASESYYYHQYSALEELDNGTGTRMYHHPIPGLSQGYRRDAGQGRGAAGERGRRDSLSDSDG
jgi:hypothetical protein